jgi:ribosomal-protein-alanine N-acetyltransferase
MPTVKAIENEAFSCPWTDEDFARCNSNRNCIGMVAEVGDKVVGYMFYELHKNRLHIINFALEAAYRRQGVGRAMADKLISKLSFDRRNRLLLEVRETNLAAQLFFKQMGFRAIQTLRDRYEDTREDAYLMQYRLVNKKQDCSQEMSCHG